MAMTGGRDYLVREVKANYGKADWYIRLYVYVKEESQSVENNQTVLSLGMYVDADYNIGEWYEQSNPVGSYLGTATSGTNCRTFSGHIQENTTKYWIAENKEVTVDHNADGTKTATIYWKWNVNSPWGQCVTPSGSFNHTITTIPRATQPTVSASSSYMGTSITISMPRASGAFKHALFYSMGNESGTIGEGLGTTKTWEVPYNLAKAIPNDNSGTCTIICDTWSGGTYIGQRTVTFTAMVPDDSTTKPSISCAITPVSSLGDAFEGLFIQGLTKVKTEISAEGKYNANIIDYFSTVGNTGETISFWGDTYTHPCPTLSGPARVIYSVKDSRGIGNRGEQYIDVLPYSNPGVIPYTGDNSIVCERVKEFNAEKGIEEATNKVRIKVGRQYSPVISNGTQLNYCELRYRHKASTASSYGEWKPFIAKDSTDSDFVDVIVDDIATSLSVSYDVQISAVDDIGTPHTVALTIPTEKVNFHEREGGDGAAFGKYSEKPKSLEVAEDWDFVVYGDRWQSLPYSSAVSASTLGIGEGPANDAVYYRVENGNHVYVAFNCAFEFNGNAVTINATNIPEEYRPKRYVSSMCSAGDSDGDRGIAKIVVNPLGEIVISWVQTMSSASVTTSAIVSWIYGYIDYFISP